MADFTTLILSGAYAASVATTLDILQAASILAPRVKAPRPTWRVLSADAPSVQLSNSMQMEATALPKRPRPDGDTWIVPGLGPDHAGVIATCLAQDDAQRVARALAAQITADGQVAASCSVVFLLQAGGLLHGRCVTTSWWLVPTLQQWEPACMVDADRMVCTDGPIAIVGAVFAQTDLMLHLPRTRFGVALTDAVGRVPLIDGRHAQAPFVLPAMLANGSALITRLVARIEAVLPNPPSVRTLADKLAMSQRTLSRHAREATGGGTLVLVQSVHLDRARMPVESSRVAVDSVTGAVGYEDVTILRRLMCKVSGTNPSQYRPAAQGPGSRVTGCYTRSRSTLIFV